MTSARARRVILTTKTPSFAKASSYAKATEDSDGGQAKGTKLGPKVLNSRIELRVLGLPAVALSLSNGAKEGAFVVNSLWTEFAPVRPSPGFMVFELK